MKKFVVAVLALLLAFGIAACSDPGAGAGEYEVNYRIGGEIVHTVETKDGGFAEYTPEAKTGHTFDGWYTSSDCTGEKFTALKTDKNLDLYGKYVPVVYTVTLDVDGVKTTVSADHGTAAELPTPDPKTGHTFDGWYTSEDLTGDKYDESALVTGDLDLFGTYKPNEYTVSIDVDGQKSMVKAEYGSVAELPTPELKTGHTFDGWYTDRDLQAKYDEQTVISGNINLYGTYRPIMLTVALNVDGTKTEVETAYGTVANISAGDRTGYEFDGWYTSSTLSGDKYDLKSTVTENINLYGRYTQVFAAQYTATSADEANGAALASDGMYGTYWKAAEVGENSLTVDLGATRDVRSVTQKFAESAVWDLQILGSADNEHFVPFASCAKQAADDTYTVTVNGYFRYVKLVVKNADKYASSCEFTVKTADMTKGTNIALGMKGSSDSWAGGCETENAFDGNYENMYCANDGNMGHYLAVEWTYMCYVEYTEFYMPDPGTFNYEIEGRLEDGSWTKIETACDHTGQIFRLTVKREVSALLIRYFNTPGWNAVREWNVYGFKNVANGITPAETDDGNVYEIGDSFVGGIVVAGEDATAEYSVDGVQWTAATVTDGFARVDAYAGFVRTSGAAKIYATPLNIDLALYIVPTTANEGDTSNDPPYFERVCTMNPENVWRQFWCSSEYNSVRELTFDLGNACILDSFVYTFQDGIADPKYKLKVEISLDGVDYTTKFDNFETGGAGRTFTGSLDGTLARYVKVTVLYVDGWTNCRQFSLYGVGAPVRYVEIR